MAETDDAVRKWLNSLEERERNMAELLDSYFTFRSSLPGTDGLKMTADPKTTEDIRDDLQDMMNVPADFIFTYMRKHGFGFTTGQDGSVRWAVWRLPV